MFTSIDEYREEGIGLTRADDDRLNGKRKIDRLLADMPDGLPGIQVFEPLTQAVATLKANADVLRKYASWRITIEGHCDERGTSAYNLVLGEKRAKAARNYLVELGVSANRLGVVSYGKERPFCKEHSESCYAQNRRGHVVVKTGK